jgi:hypothetical protein
MLEGSVKAHCIEMSRSGGISSLIENVLEIHCNGVGACRIGRGSLEYYSSGRDSSLIFNCYGTVSEKVIWYQKRSLGIIE